MSQSTLQTAIREELLSRIQNGHFKPGEKFPTEHALCEEFGVSRTTVRGALNQLTIEGYLVRQQGRGTFVADGKVSASYSDAPPNYSANLAFQGQHGQVSVIDLSVISATGQLASVFEVSKQTPIQKIERLRHVDEEPMQYEISFIPWGIVPGMTHEEAKYPLYQTLSTGQGVRVAKTTEALADFKPAPEFSDTLWLGYGTNTQSELIPLMRDLLSHFCQFLLWYRSKLFLYCSSR